VALSRDTVLMRQSELSVHVSSNGEVEIVHRGGSAYGGPHTLSILDAFSEARTLGAVVDELSARSARDFATLTTTILELHSQAILTAPGVAPVLADTMGWDAPSVHARMLGDFTRTDAFLRALREVVRPDDVVVDIGTGTGVLALGAAKAGARKVFAVESSSIAEIASEMFVKNGQADRIELIRGWSTRIDLPQRASVLVSETIGNQAFGESIIETAIDARRRLLEPDARLIPSRVRVYAQPYVMREAVRREHLFSKENVARWNELYGMDFSPLVDTVGQRPLLLSLRHFEAAGWEPLGPKALLVDMDLANAEAAFERTGTSHITESGELGAFLEFFELTLSPSIEFDGHPHHVPSDCSWRFPAWVLPEARPVRAGDRIPLTYRYRAGRAKLHVGE
jgi:predicted RNA methylase